jgi:two-component sensor histidine kinase
MGVDRAIPAGLILNELVSNALKHAFPEGRGGEVNIHLRREDGTIHVEVADNGAGLPAGLDLKKTKSLGLKIVDILTRQLKGSVEISSEGGASFRFSFPEK